MRGTKKVWIHTTPVGISENKHRRRISPGSQELLTGDKSTVSAVAASSPWRTPRLLLLSLTEMVYPRTSANGFVLISHTALSPLLDDSQIRSYHVIMCLFDWEYVAHLVLY